jgi:cold-inducible RNA-binding protein
VFTTKKEFMIKLVVQNLSFSADEADVRSLFEEFGPVLSVKGLKDPSVMSSEWFALVELRDPDLAREAVRQLHGQTFHGRLLAVKESDTTEKKRNWISRPTLWGGDFPIVASWKTA